jgi:hypothetical protein
MRGSAIFAAVCIASSGFILSSQDAEEKDYRWSIPPGTDFPSIYMKPTEIDSDTQFYFTGKGGETRLRAISDYHGLYPIELSRYYAFLRDYENKPKHSSMMLANEVDYSQKPYVIQTQTLGFNVLGMKLSYTVKFLGLDTFPEPNVMASWWRQVDGEKSAFFETYGSYYLVEMPYQGKKCTYVRYFQRIGIRNPFAGLTEIVRIFGGIQMKSVLNSNFKAASEY